MLVVIESWFSLLWGHNCGCYKNTMMIAGYYGTTSKSLVNESSLSHGLTMEYFARAYNILAGMCTLRFPLTVFYMKNMIGLALVCVHLPDPATGVFCLTPPMNP